MKLTNAALGLAAVGAGLLVARLLRQRAGEASDTEYVAVEPPEPNRLIGYPTGQLNADEAAAAFSAPDRGRPL